jgi:hypothetical protein
MNCVGRTPRSAAGPPAGLDPTAFLFQYNKT